MMIAYLLIALFVFSGIVTLMSLADSAVRARNAFRDIRCEMRPAQDLDLPSFSSDVVRLPARVRPARVVTRRQAMQPQRAAA